MGRLRRMLAAAMILAASPVRAEEVRSPRFELASSQWTCVAWDADLRASRLLPPDGLAVRDEIVDLLAAQTVSPGWRLRRPSDGGAPLGDDLRSG